MLRASAQAGAVLTGIGIVSPVGDDAENTAAAIECGVSAMRTITIPDRGGNELVGCPLLDFGSRHGHVRRLWDAALRAAREAVAQAGLLDAAAARPRHLFWTSPPPGRIGYRLDPQGAPLREFVDALGWRDRELHVHDVAIGHAAGVLALQQAVAVLARDPAAICLIGGADTLVQLRVLRLLERADRLKTELWPDGLVPGEGAAFLVVEAAPKDERSEAPIFCAIEAVSCEVDLDADIAASNARGERLGRALVGAATAAARDPASVVRVWADLNGESRRANEWTLASMRALDGLGWTAELAHPADCIGDIGAASAVMLTALSALHLRQCAAGSRAMVVAASDSGERAAAMLRRGDTAPAPRPRVEAMSGEGRALLQRVFDDLGFLGTLRRARVLGPEARLGELELLDARIRSHIQAMVTAGPALRRVEMIRSEVAVSDVFAIASAALAASEGRSLEFLCELAASAPELAQAIAEAIEFTAAPHLAGIVAHWAGRGDPLRVGLAARACAQHGVDAVPLLNQLLERASGSARVECLRAAAFLARTDLLTTCLAALDDDDPDCREQAVCSAILLGDRQAAIARALAIGVAAGSRGEHAFELALMALPIGEAGERLAQAVRAGLPMRRQIRAVAVVGDPVYLPWLVERMQDPAQAGLAGAAFAMITGLELPARQPADEAVADAQASEPSAVLGDSLPVPDPAAALAWLREQGRHLAPEKRFFRGMPLSPESCRRALGEASQRQRRVAAAHLVIIEPGTLLFNTAAPAWRQRRRLRPGGGTS